MRNTLTINALQNQLFCILKAAVLHGKTVGFALQNSRFRITKQKRFCRCFFIAQLLFALPLDRWQKG
ncbi:hypothetical protein [Prevotella intermedia]|uniref:Uncharacterized protein n=1 Tax=Prevotella intermedia TaxID=28131 RepID=A0A425VQK3_PREIN|nr:hypothetical protein [Prevotella intermedia]RRF87886.1 hypothetical protein D2S45_03040 [Prevotella intermedia]